MTPRKLNALFEQHIKYQQAINGIEPETSTSDLSKNAKSLEQLQKLSKLQKGKK